MSPRARHDDGRIGVLTLALYVGTCYGGAERVAFDFVKYLNPERFRRYLCVVQAPPADRRHVNEADMAELEGTGVELLRLECSSTLSNAAWARVYPLLRREPIDVLHAHMPRASVPGAVLGRLARTPAIVSHEHTWSFQGRPVRKFLDRNVVARLSDVVLAVSEQDRQQMIEVERMPPERIRVLPNGIPAPQQDSNGGIRAELGVPDDVALIGAVGRLYAQKGYDDLVRAVKLLEQDQPRPFRCLIFGHGPEAESLQRLIDQEGVGEVLGLAGRRQDIADVIGALDVAVMPSRYEGTPLAVLEYMAGGAPIVATAVGGVPELLEDGVNAVLVPPEDPAALAGGLRRLLEDRELASRLGHAARERQRQRYDLKVVLEELEELYVELHEMSQKPSTRRRHRGPRWG